MYVLPKRSRVIRDGFRAIPAVVASGFKDTTLPDKSNFVMTEFPNVHGAQSFPSGPRKNSSGVWPSAPGTLCKVTLPLVVTSPI